MEKKAGSFCSLCFVLAACLGFLPSSASAAEIALYKGKDRQQKLIEGAKREGEVIWYTSFQTDDASKFIKLFEAKYPFLKVKLTRMTSERVLQRYMMEYQGKRFAADIVDTNDFQMELPRRKGILQPYYTPSVERFDKRFRQPDGYWNASRLTMIVHGYNTELIKPNEVPRKYEDLLNPKWKGKMSLEREQTEWFMALMELWGEEKGKAFFQKLGAQNPTFRNGHTLMSQLIMAGEDPMSPNAYSHHFPDAMKKGAPVDWVNLEPVIGKSIISAMARNAPHPHAAMLFYDFFFSAEGGQKVVQQASRIPTHPDLTPLTPRLREGFDFIIVDPGNYMDKINRYEKLWREWVIRGS